MMKSDRGKKRGQQDYENLKNMFAIKFFVYTTQFLSNFRIDDTILVVTFLFYYKNDVLCLSLFDTRVLSLLLKFNFLIPYIYLKCKKENRLFHF